MYSRWPANADLDAAPLAFDAPLPEPSADFAALDEPIEAETPEIPEKLRPAALAAEVAEDALPESAASVADLDAIAKEAKSLNATEKEVLRGIYALRKREFLEASA